MRKSGLRLRPICHQKNERVEAHILVCFLAYLFAQADSIGPLLLSLVQSEVGEIPPGSSEGSTADVILPTLGGPEVRIRCVVRPDDAQSILIQRLGLELPQRLRIPKTVKM